MPIEPTRVSRYSFGWVNSAQSIVDKDPADTGRDFSCINGASTGSFYVAGALGVGGTLTGAALSGTAGTLTSTLTVGGAATFQSTVTARGQVNADAGIQVGGGTNLQVISTGTTALSFGAINPLESSSVITFAVSGLSRGDFLAICPDSLYPVVAANRDISYFCSSSSTAGEAHAWAVNSTLTAVTPTASTYFRWLRVKAGNFPAA